MYEVDEVDEGKDYVVYRDNRTGEVFVCLWAEWEEWTKHENYRKGANKLVAQGLTIEQAQAMVRLTREEN